MYQGHKNWNAWNVSLWLNNDETLYSAMLSHMRAANNKNRAARSFHHALTHADYGTPTPRTPDGAPYTFTNIRAAMRGLDV